jgi:hypothetical protein
VSEPALSLAFFDPAREVHGTVRSGVAVLFQGTEAHTLEAEPEIDRDGERFSARVGSDVDLSFEPYLEPADLGGASVRLARVSGRAGGGPVECLGTVGETHEPPVWDELDAVRLVSAIFDEENALVLAARRPRGAVGHDVERVTAHLWTGGQHQDVENARISTVYDAQGRQRSVGLELWLPGEDFPRRASGSVRAGLSLALAGLRVDAAVVGWRMDGRDGAGSYEITARDEPQEAA